MRNIRKWEHMPTDCLVNIFGRLPLESRLLDVPLVCKPWLQAVRNPLCWQILFFPAYISYHSRLKGQYLYSRNSGRIKLIPFVFNLSQRCATSLSLPGQCSREELKFVSEECPALKMLVLPACLCQEYSAIIPSLIVKLKNLEYLGIGSTRCDWIVQIFELIRIHLPNFIGLRLTSRNIDDAITLAIVKLLPKLKELFIFGANLSKENLLLIMQGCKELVRLDARNCIGFDEDDEGILKHSSAIKDFQCDGSKAYDDFYEGYVDVYDGSDNSD